MMRRIFMAAAVLGFSGQVASALTVMDGEQKMLTPEQSAIPRWVETRFDRGDQAGRDVCVPFLAAMGLTGQVPLGGCLVTIAALNGRNQLDMIAEGDVLWLPAMDNDPAEVQARVATRLADKALADSPLGPMIKGLIADVALLQQDQAAIKKRLPEGQIATTADLATLKAEVLTEVNAPVAVQTEKSETTEPTALVGKVIPAVAPDTDQKWSDWWRPPAWVQVILSLLILVTVGAFAFFFLRIARALGGQIADHDEQLDNHTERLGVVETEIDRWKEISIPGGLQTALLGLEPGTTHHTEVGVDGVVYAITFAPADHTAKGAMVTLEGVAGQTQPVLVANVLTVLKRAARSGRLINAKPAIRLVA